MSGPVSETNTATASSSSTDELANDVKKLRFKDNDNSEDDDEDDEEEAKERAKKEKKAAAKKKAESTSILISKSQRQRNKFITTVKGLESIGDLKKIAQKCAKKFACSASVVKAADLSSEIAIQGDVMQDLPDFLVAEYPNIDKSTMYFYTESKRKQKCF
jgi:density-regulated protein DRP1